MCLESTRLFPKIAKEDIVVCKQLAYCDGKLKTWYRDYPVTNTIMKTKFPLFTIVKLLFKSRIHGRYSIEEGFIHSYSNASCFYNELGEFDGYTMHVKAVIPKGALYYKDYWGGTYASNILILKPSEKQLPYFKNK